MAIRLNKNERDELDSILGELVGFHHEGGSRKIDSEANFKILSNEVHKFIRNEGPVRLLIYAENFYHLIMLYGFICNALYRYGKRVRLHQQPDDETSVLTFDQVFDKDVDKYLKNLESLPVKFHFVVISRELKFKGRKGWTTVETDPILGAFDTQWWKDRMCARVKRWYNRLMDIQIIKINSYEEYEERKRNLILSIGKEIDFGVKPIEIERNAYRHDENILINGYKFGKTKEEAEKYAQRISKYKNGMLLLYNIVIIHV